MSSWEEEAVCPRCDGQMMACRENRPYDKIFGECLDCCFCYYSVDDQLSLKDVNVSRKWWGLRPITKLKKASTQKMPDV